MWRGWVWLGVARYGWVWLGMVGCGKAKAAQDSTPVPLFFSPSIKHHFGHPERRVTPEPPPPISLHYNFLRSLIRRPYPFALWQLLQKKYPELTHRHGMKRPRLPPSFPFFAQIFTGRSFNSASKLSALRRAVLTKLKSCTILSRLLLHTSTASSYVGNSLTAFSHANFPA